MTGALRVLISLDLGSASLSLLFPHVHGITPPCRASPDRGVGAVQQLPSPVAAPGTQQGLPLAPLSSRPSLAPPSRKAEGGRRKAEGGRRKAGEALMGPAWGA